MHTVGAPAFDVEQTLLGGKVHFMGVRGAGMSPLAELLLRSGGAVSGCDISSDERLAGMEALGLELHVGHDPAHVEDARALIITAAVPDDHREIVRARELGIPVLKRALALGAWVNRGTVIAIAGTHGKTTTTALATHVLAACGRDPTGIVGGEVAGWGGNLRFGTSDLFVVEADEYDRSFHALCPHVAVVTNMEADHLDIYDDFGGVRRSFETFVGGLRDEGALWVCGDDPGAGSLATFGGSRSRSYGLSAGCQLRATDVTWSPTGSRFHVYEDGVRMVDVKLPVPGVHNVRNALGAAGAARSMGADWDDIRTALADFPGVGRRYDVLGVASGVEVIDDYAHHPTEIAATLDAVRASHPGQRIVAVFQPHLFSRTRDFAKDFGRALGGADRVWITDVYPAREDPIAGVTGELVYRSVPPGAAMATYHAELESLAPSVAEDLRDGDVCVVMGAGSIEATGSQILGILEERQGDG